MNRQSSQRRHGERGSSIIEFALVAPLLVVIIGGVAVTGVNLARMVQVSQVSRDAASMYVRGVDFSRTGNQDVLVRLSRGLNITRTGGDGVIILSKVTFIPHSKCQDLQLASCNSNDYVITQRIVIGNGSLRSSALGTPLSHLIDSQGNVRDYMKEPSAVANFSGITLGDGQYSYVAESYVRGTGEGVYSRAIF